MFSNRFQNTNEKRQFLNILIAIPYVTYSAEGFFDFFIKCRKHQRANLVYTKVAKSWPVSFK